MKKIMLEKDKRKKLASLKNSNSYKWQHNYIEMDNVVIEQLAIPINTNYSHNSYNIRTFCYKKGMSKELVLSQKIFEAASKLKY